MKYTVIISSPALLEIELAYQWLAERSPTHAPRWHNELADAITSLEDNPLRCPIVPEDDQVSEETHQLLFGSKRHAYRILFALRNEKVWVLHVRHAARL